jgi:glycosyltransferase involved in cell wall biosynthesis
MILGIDASNIRTGGGLTHLKQMLQFVNLSNSHFDKVIVWSSDDTLKQLCDVPWLIKQSHPYLNKSFTGVLLFQLFILNKKAKQEHCSIIFSPGGTFLCSFRPFVSMSQNMLPFELKEAFRFKKLKTRLRFLALRITQSYTFERADGLIFLTKYAKQIITNKLTNIRYNTVIPHGIDPAFSKRPNYQHSPSFYTFQRPFTLLYVSIITAYKHQWNVAKSICKLRKEGYPLSLILVGPKEQDAYNKLTRVLDSDKLCSTSIKYLGTVKHKELFDFYNSADAFVFASSCENMPIILIEAMSAGLPIACSNRGPMPEILEDAGIYFNPEDLDGIYDALKELFLNVEKRNILANKAYEKSINYSWKDCANDTIEFLYKIVKNENNLKDDLH